MHGPQVPAQNIISVHNVSEIYKVPLVLQKQNVAEIISDKLQMYLPKGMPNIDEWEQLCRKLDGVEQKVPLHLPPLHLDQDFLLSLTLVPLSTFAWSCESALR
jgi:CTP synthase (UTP-ammonia lyase)